MSQEAKQIAQEAKGRHQAWCKEEKQPGEDPMGLWGVGEEAERQGLPVDG